MTAFPQALAKNDGRTTLVELVPWAGPLQDEAGERHRETGRELASDDRVTALTITDNAGGFVRLGPLTLGRAIHEMGGEVVVHLACRDRSRASLQSTAFGLASEGLTNVLALSGDYPKEGFHGRSRAVFDIDSVGLTLAPARRVRPRTALHHRLRRQPLQGRGGRPGAAVPEAGHEGPRRCRPGRHPGRLRRTLVVGAVAWNASAGPGIPLMASVYILSKGVATVFHRDGVPGIRLTDGLHGLGRAPGGCRRQGPCSVPRVRRQADSGRPRHGLRRHLHRRAAQRWPRSTRCCAWPTSSRPTGRPAPGHPRSPSLGAHRLFEPGELPQLSSDRPDRTDEGQAGAADVPLQPARARSRLRPRARAGLRSGPLGLRPPRVGTPDEAGTRPRAGCQAPHVRLPGLRRLFAARHRLPVPRGRLCQEPAQRTVRRLHRRRVRGARQALRLDQRLRSTQARTAKP